MPRLQLGYVVYSLCGHKNNVKRVTIDKIFPRCKKSK